MSSLLWPTTDAGVLAQLVVLLALVGVALWRWGRQPDARLLVIGAGIALLALMGLRAAH